MAIDMNHIATHIDSIVERIKAAENKYQRPVNSVQLLAVGKTHSSETLQQAIDAGAQHLAENYLQEALPKIVALQKQVVTWHYIGSIQANKTKQLAQRFDWVQTLDRIKIAARLAEHRPANRPPLNVCIQVNPCAEKTKSGIALDDVATFADQLCQFPQLKLRGLMTIPPKSEHFQQQFENFQQVQQAFAQLQQLGYAVDTLSMGMTNDLEAAIAAGSTMVRVGRGIFGERKSHA